jgi:hypothetical protein
VVTINPYTSETSLPGAQATTDMQTGSITVFYGRIRHELANRPGVLPMFVAYVLAHEVTHVLQGGGHSRSGIMKARWDGRDCLDIENGSLQFSAEDVARIHLGLTSRSLPPTSPLSPGAIIPDRLRP